MTLRNPQVGEEVIFTLRYESFVATCTGHNPGDVRKIVNVLRHVERVVLNCGCNMPFSTGVVEQVDQVIPIISDEGPAIQDLVIQDIESRKAIGLAKYKTLVRPLNGRNALRDAYEEVIDLAVYLRQLIEEDEIRRREDTE